MPPTCWATHALAAQSHFSGLYTPIYVAPGCQTAAEPEPHSEAGHDAGRSAGPIRPSPVCPFWRQVGQIALNPMIIGSVLAWSLATGWELPGPFRFRQPVAGASIRHALLRIPGRLAPVEKPRPGVRRRVASVSSSSSTREAWLLAGPVMGLSGEPAHRGGPGFAAHGPERLRVRFPLRDRHGHGEGHRAGDDHRGDPGDDRRRPAADLTGHS